MNWGQIVLLVLVSAVCLLVTIALVIQIEDDVRTFLARVRK